MCVEESAAETRGARLALRRAAMRRQVARAATTLQLNKGHKEYKALASIIKVCKNETCKFSYFKTLVFKIGF